MKHLRVFPVLMLLSVVGCSLPEERPGLRPLPEDGPPISYAELLTRARTQTTAATEAFHLDNWSALEDAAKNLEQTARFLGRAVDVPDKHKDTLPAVAGELGKEASALRTAAGAKDKDIRAINTSLQKLNLRVREMRLEK